MTLRIKTVGGLLLERFYVLEGLTAVRKTLRLPAARQMSWSFEKIGGGGWVTGLAISPDGLTRLTRTDVGGGWRWDDDADIWQADVTADSLPIGDPGSVPFSGDGVHGIAVVNDAAYMAYNDMVYKSVDRGLTWVVVKTGIPTAPNETARWWHPNLTVDPNNHNRVLYGTFSTGVWFSLNAGSTWTQVSSGSVPFGLPADQGPMGIHVVGIHPATGDLYACPFGQGVYRSTTSGSTWSKISSDAMFTTACGMAFLSNGDVMVTGLTSSDAGQESTSVYRYSGGVWTVVPLLGAGNQRAWRSIAADPFTAGRVVIQAIGGYTRISLDQGATFTISTVTFNDPDTDVPWLVASNAGFTTIGGLQFDPLIAGRLWMSQGIGVWYADLTSPSAVDWNTRTRGLEEMVVNDVVAAPGDKPLAMCWDRPIFKMLEDGDAYPTHYHPHDGVFSSAWQAAYSADNTEFVVATIANHQLNGAGTPAETGYSGDGGHTWTPFATIPLNSTNATGTFGFGSVNVSGNSVVWVGNNSHGAYYSPDLGATWTKIVIPTIPDSAWNQKPYFVLRQPVTAEATAGHQGTFYAFILNSGIWRSVDGGATWAQRCTYTPFTLYSGTTWEWHVRFKAVPGQTGHLFITSGRLGGPVLTTPLLKSTNGGTTWTDTTMRQVSAFDFGKPAPGSAYPAVYAYGVGVGGLGLYRSADGGSTWAFLTPAAPALKAINGLAASKDTYGLVWLGTGGQGVVRGEYVNVS